MRRHCRKCPLHAKFNFKGERSPVYCREHAEHGMVDIFHRRCVHDRCTTVPSYHFEGNKPPAYCKKHAVCGMVDVKNKRCSSDSCTKIPSFNLEGIKPAVYCKQHAKAGMVDVHSPRCVHDSCKTQPQYNFEGRKKAYCKRHATDGMINVVCTKRSSNYLSTVVGTPRRVSRDSAPTTDVSVKIEILGDPVASVSVGASYDSGSCLKQQSEGIDEKQVAHCLDHAPLKNGFAASTAVEMVRSREHPPTSACHGPMTHLADNGHGVRMAAKIARHQLYRRASPPE